MKEKSFVVYRHTSPSGKVYIGITGMKPSYRWNGGKGYKNNKHFYHAILKHGWENFTHEILFSGLSKEEATEKEIELIKKHNSTNHLFGYNVESGGQYAAPSEETRKLWSEMRKGEKNHFYGKHHSKETRSAISEKAMGRKATEETKRKLSESHSGERHWNYGKHFSEETRRKMSEAQKGEKASNYGKRLSEETRKKISKNHATKKKVICIETGIIYDSVMEAKRETGIDNSLISKVCNGRVKHAHGFHWKYID